MSGILGKGRLAQDTNTTLYTVPAEKLSVVAVSMCNTGGETAKVNVALSDGGNPAAGDYIEYGFSIAPSGSLERTGLVLDAGKRLIVRSTTDGVDAVVYGMEE